MITLIWWSWYLHQTKLHGSETSPVISVSNSSCNGCWVCSFTPQYISSSRNVCNAWHLQNDDHLTIYWSSDVERCYHISHWSELRDVIVLILTCWEGSGSRIHHWLLRSLSRKLDVEWFQDKVKQHLRQPFQHSFDYRDGCDISHDDTDDICFEQEMIKTSNIKHISISLPQSLYWAINLSIFERICWDLSDEVVKWKQNHFILYNSGSCLIIDYRQHSRILQVDHAGQEPTNRNSLRRVLQRSQS